MLYFNSNFTIVNLLTKMGNYISGYAFCQNIANDKHIPCKIDSLGETFYKLIKSEEGTNVCVIFCHGNACTVDVRMINLFKDMKLKADVYLFEYPGYGESRKENTNSTNVRERLDNLYKNLENKYADIIFVGHSLGAGVVLDYMKKNNLNNRCILLSPFLSIMSVFSEPMSYLIDEYMNYENIKDMSNVHIIHGTEDDVIPTSHSVKLAGEKHKLTLLDCDHNTIIYRIDFVNILSDYIEKEHMTYNFPDCSLD